ncbi:MAG: NAD(+) synthase [Actinobacteria bacterium]|nr:NAD(+) synthase [Actinomycetota bacterium]
MENDPTVNAQLAIKNLTEFMAGELGKSGFKNLIVGLDGSIDSIVGTYLAVKVAGSQNTIALIMPYEDDKKEGLADSEIIAKLLGLDFKMIDISPAINLYLTSSSDVNKVRLNHKIAFERFSYSYDTALKESGLLVKTDNKAKFIFGKIAPFCFNERIINLFIEFYRTQIKQIAKLLDVPEEIINRDSCVDFLKDVSIEEMDNFSYDNMDRFLYLMIDKHYGKPEIIAEMGIDEIFIDTMWNLVERSVEKIKRIKF